MTVSILGDAVAPLDSIAVVGMSGRFPAARNVTEFWRNLVAGRECLGHGLRVSEGDAHADGARWVEAETLLPEADLFDAEFFGFSPREAEMTEPQHRILLELAWEALESGGFSPSAHADIGVFAGAGFTSYYSIPDATSHVLGILPQMIGADKDYLATRISHRLNLTGPAITVQSACSTSLAAVHLACQAITAGECSAALAGGAQICVPRLRRHLYMPGGIVSPDGYCRAFDAEAKGTIFAEGAGMVLLMPLQDAIARKLHVYAVVRGSAMNNDGGDKAGYSAPSLEGQLRVLRQAHTVAGVRPDEFGYVEAHGTGTVVGDGIEVGALKRAFRGAEGPPGFCRLGSVKTNIGHLGAASGVAGLIKATLALDAGIIPPTVNLTTANPELDLDASPFHVNVRSEPWPEDGTRRLAGVSSFGIGGTNVHIVLERAPVVARRATRKAWHVLPLSARTRVSVEESAERVAHTLRDETDDAVADAAFTLARRQRFAHRAALVATPGADGLQWKRLPVEQAPLTGMTRPRIAFLFPGQGAQRPGMAADLYEAEPVFRRRLDEGLGHFAAVSEIDLAGLLLGQPDDASATEALTRTAAAQPALFLTSYSLAKLFESYGVRPDLMLGHSIGEYVAACLSGVLSLPDAVRLVAKRGAMMGEMASGAMLSILARADEVEARMPDGLDWAAFNGPNQNVVSGPVHEIERLEQILKSDGIACRRLQTSHAFHSRMMEPMVAAFDEVAGSVARGPASIPYVSNLTGARMTAQQMAEPGYWSRHVRQPVRFAEGLSELQRLGADIFLEVGPGQQLSQMVRQSIGREARAIHSVDAGRGAGGSVVGEALARLWTFGVDVDLEARYGGEARRVVPLPTYAFDRSRFWLEPEAKPVRGGPSGKLEAIDWCYVPTWRQQTPTRNAEGWREGEHVLLISANADLATTLSQSLEALALRVSRIDHAVGPTRLGHVDLRDRNWVKALDDLAADPPARVIYLCSHQPAAPLDVGAFLEAQQLGLFALLRFLRHKVGEAHPIRLDIVGGPFFDVTGCERVRPELAPLLAFAGVAPQEHGHVSCRVIDIDPGEPSYPSIRRIISALALPPEQPLAAVRGDHVWRRGFERVVWKDEAGDDAGLRAGGVYLVTGGLGDIGLSSVELLASQVRATFVLMTRRTFADRAEWPAILRDPESDPSERDIIETIQRVEDLGSSVFIFRGDVSDLDDVRRLRAFLDTDFGGLNGAILAAGKLGLNDILFDERDAETYVDHFSAKTFGLMHFIREFGGCDLDFCILTSSLSTILGGLGHCAYAAANHAADALLSQHNLGRARPWTSSKWDLWRPRDPLNPTSRVAHLYETAIGAEEGKALLRRLFSESMADVVISTRDLDAQYQRWIVNGGRMPDRDSREPSQLHGRPESLGPFQEPEGELEAQVAAIWREALGIENVGRDDDFFQLGGHSLLMVQIVRRVSECFDLDVPIGDAFAAVTVRHFARLLENAMREALAALEAT